MAQRYGVLPSDFLARGNSFDITVANVAQEYINRKTAEANGQPTPKPVNNLTVEQMQAMVNRVRKEN
jgi:hypothetical protein